MKSCGIYHIDIHGATYVGSTRQEFQKRWNKHKSQLSTRTHPNNLLQEAYDSLLWGGNPEIDVVFSILEELPEDMTDAFRLKRERYWINFIKPTCNENWIERTKPTNKNRARLSQKDYEAKIFFDSI